MFTILRILNLNSLFYTELQSSIWWTAVSPPLVSSVLPTLLWPWQTDYSNNLCEKGHTRHVSSGCHSCWFFRTCCSFSLNSHHWFSIWTLNNATIFFVLAEVFLILTNFEVVVYWTGLVTGTVPATGVVESPQEQTSSTT